jgi:hypothetical protein
MRPNTKAIAINAHIAISSNSSHISSAPSGLGRQRVTQKLPKVLASQRVFGIRH